MKLGKALVLNLFLQDLLDLCEKHKVRIVNMDEVDIVPVNGFTAKPMRRRRRKKRIMGTGKRLPIDGDKLTAEVKRRKKTFSYLARKVGCAPTTIRGWILGISNPTEEMIHAMARVLRVTPERLIKL